MNAAIEHTKDLPTIHAEPTPMGMLQLAVQQGADVEKLEKLMALQERWEANEARKAFAVAFAEFKEEAVTIIRNKLITDGPLKGKRYADLFSVVNVITPALCKHGFSFSWRLTKDDKDWLEVTCTLKHVKGHTETVPMGGAPDAGGAKNSIQARASTISYLERYTLLAATGLAASDTDTDGGSKKEEKAEPDAEGKKALEAAGSLNALQDAWKALTAKQRATLGDAKDACKERILAAEKAAAGQ